MRPNILLITTDQQRFDTIRALGNESIRTPHLDLLARTGIVFTSAYADCPICIPARWTIMNGQRGATYHHAYYEDRVRMAVEPNKSLPGVLSHEGYQTQAIGKMHFWPERARYGFDNMKIPKDYYRMMQKHPQYGVPMNHGLGQNEIYPTMSTTDETHSITAWTVDESINFIETRDPDCPFFLWTSFSKPHPPLDPPEPYYSMYKNKPVPKPAKGEWLTKYHDQTGHIWDNRSHPNDYITDELRDDAVRVYYGLISQIDFNLGKLFGRLKELDLWDNTLLIFTSDHGEMLGDHGGYGKGFYFEGSAHLPFMMKLPKRFEKESFRFKYDMPVTHADIFPTVMDIAGILPEEKGVAVDGVSLLKLMEKPELRKYVMGEWSPTSGQNSDTSNSRFFITNGRYKYIYHVNGGVELLFDLVKDPREEKDLSTNRDYQGVLKELKEELGSQLKAAKHPAITGDGSFVKTEAKMLPEEERIYNNGLHTPDYDVDVLH